MSRASGGRSKSGHGMKSGGGGPRVRIVQLLCSGGQCLAACFYYAADDGKEEPSVAFGLKARYERTGGQQVCEFCGSKQITIEDRGSIFRTMEEAEPVLKQAGRRQRFKRAVIDA